MTKDKKNMDQASLIFQQNNNNKSYNIARIVREPLSIYSILQRNTKDIDLEKLYSFLTLTIEDMVSNLLDSGTSQEEM